MHNTCVGDECVHTQHMYVDGASVCMQSTCVCGMGVCMYITCVWRSKYVYTKHIYVEGKVCACKAHVYVDECVHAQNMCVE